jgi:hypothetical protein
MSEFGQLRGEFLNFDFREFAKLAEFFKRAPQFIRPATAQLLNDLAFAWRPLALSTLASKLTIRNPKFILSRMSVVKTTAKPVAQQSVIVGSTIVRGKTGAISFDGFFTLQTGRDPQRNRTMALLARGGDKQSPVQRGNRLIPDSQIASTDDVASVRGSRAQALIQDMAKNAPNKPFIIKRGYGLAPGLYRIKSGASYMLPGGRPAPKIQIIQRFGKKPRHERWAWLDESVRRLLTHAPMAKMWNTAITKAVDDAVRKAGLQSK